MPDLTDAGLDAALAHGEAARQTEPRASAARYDGRADRVVVELTNGCTFAFPPRLAQGLETATPDQLAKVEVLGAGSGLHPGDAGHGPVGAGASGWAFRDQDVHGPTGRAGHITGEGCRRTAEWRKGGTTAAVGLTG